MKILFSAKDHKYSSGDTVFTSVSKLLEKYKNEFDKDHWSKYSALKRLLPDFDELKKGNNVANSEFINELLYLAVDRHGKESVDKEIDNVLKQWSTKNSESIDRGNMYHLSQEQKAYKDGYSINPFDGKNYIIQGSFEDKEEKYSIADNLYDLEDGYYPELLLWNTEYTLAGQSDKVYIQTIDGIRYVDVDDYKTNSKITKSSFKGKRMKHPVSHLYDSKYNYYNLQISAYAWLLEQFGFVPRNLAFHHYNKMYKLDYLKTEIESILKNEKSL